MIRWLMISFYCPNIIIKFTSKGFWPSVSLSSISLLEDNDDDHAHKKSCEILPLHGDAIVVLSDTKWELVFFSG